MSCHNHNVKQPESFSFTPGNLVKAQAHIAKYPEGRQQSAVMPLLTLAQQQHDGWLPVAAIECVAKMLGMPYIRAYEVASFYSMYNLAPAGKHHVQVCTTTPCWLRGSDEVMRACRDTLGVNPGETTADGQFKLSEVECLGACVNAPMLQITSGYDDKYFEDLSYANTRELLQAVARGEEVKPGPQSARVSSEPASGLTSLTEI
jgi:NADH-quinone oxidoreductase subunit E/NADH dehydrogenase (ubiquinone) flavoprotein 2